MSDFQPYRICHIQVDDLEGQVLAEGPHYLVLWKGRTPVGHYWLSSFQGGALGAHVQGIREAVRAGLEAAAPPGSAAPLSLSIVICTRNRPADLRRSIEALLASADKAFELIVVDNASDNDETERVVRAYPSVRYIREDRPGLDIARNTGAFAASGEIVAYTDDDVEVDTSWTGGLKTAFGDPLVMAVTGLVIPLQVDTEAQYTFERHWSFGKGYVPKVFDHRWFLAYQPYSAPAWEIGAGANMAFRRDIFRLAGGFDERLDVGASGCSGDSEMWYRVLAEGWNCLYLPRLVVYHRHRATMAELRRQLFFYMRGHVSALLVQYERYRQPGDRLRVFRGLPRYYWQRWRGEKEKRDTLWNEIRGCVSGWHYYRSVKNRTALPFPRDDGAPTGAAATPETLVSVIIPSYNHAAYLGRAIQSALDQTHRRVEVIVVDDGSDDGTKEVCRAFEDVRYVRVERVGPCAARNIGVQHSRGDFLVFLDADDVLYPNALELNLYYFGYDPRLVMVSGAHDRIDEAGHLLDAPPAIEKAGDNYIALLEGNYIGMEATVMYRRGLFFRYSFNPSVVSCEDYDLNIRIARDHMVFGHAGKVAAYRIHGGNRSGDKTMMKGAALQVLRRQADHIRGPEERRAYEQGLRNWTAYYKDL
jgi:glycosyltransferase involved in cell wall biosynthesis